MQSVQAAGIEGSSPLSPRAAQLASPGLLYSQLSSSESQLCLCIWPGFVLFNAMPCPAAWCMDCLGALSDETAIELRAESGAEIPLNSHGKSNERLRLKLIADGNEQVFYGTSFCAAGTYTQKNEQHLSLKQNICSETPDCASTAIRHGRCRCC